MLPYWTKTRGIGGKMKVPEDFVVREILHRKYFAKYNTSGTVKINKGKYNLFLLRKRNLTTHEALKIISSKFSVRNIGFAGLKDKHAVTEQYITMKGGDEFKEENIELINFGATDKMLSKGNLLANDFVITLHECSKTENLPEIVQEIEKKNIPNYFGPQRFGIHGNNHLIGKMIVKRDFERALKMINESYKKNYRSVKKVGKERLKFFVNAYQSWIFNEMLAEYVKRGKKISFIPIIGFKSRSPSIERKYNVKQKDFIVNELRLACSGGNRKAFVKTKIDYSVEGDNAVLKFFLPAGSYATVVLREITKSN